MGVAQCQRKLHPVWAGVIIVYALLGKRTGCLWMPAVNEATFNSILILAHPWQLTLTEAHVLPGAPGSSSVFSRLAQDSSSLLDMEPWNLLANISFTSCFKVRFVRAIPEARKRSWKLKQWGL